MNSIKPKSKRGGARPGAGRPKGSRNVATAAHIQNLGDAARGYSEIALKSLAEIAAHGESEAARVSASVHLLDRGYGKVKDTVEHVGKDGEAAIVVREELSIEEHSRNDIARRLAFLLQKGAREARAKAAAVNTDQGEAVNTK